MTYTMTFLTGFRLCGMAHVLSLSLSLSLKLTPAHIIVHVHAHAHTTFYHTDHFILPHHSTPH